MKKLFIILLCTFSTGLLAKTPATLKYPVDFLFTKVLEKKHQTKNEAIPMPHIYYKSSTPLKQFQDAIEKQWNMRPKVFTNAFAVDNNEIYIMDDASYYEEKKRCMDDSLVHELVHYVQVKYLNWDIHDESLEWDAIEIQTEFREEFCKL
ncbi:MAG: hypothetical protein H7336_00810 [Bacteriovorax sp.]|nr:hypothetical protein [Bacteriovorax sp.]